MIYLDGSKFFFDIEGCFSNLVEAARRENKEKEADPSAKKLCEGFAKYYGVNPYYISAGRDYDTVLKTILGQDDTVLIPEFDDSKDFYEHAFEKLPAFSFKKTSDMKLKLPDLIKYLEENAVSSVYLTNPCSPTSLMLSPDEVLSLASSVDAKVVVDESHITDSSCSSIKLAGKQENLIILKKVRFADKPVFVVGKSSSEYNSNISAEEQAVGTVIFEHNSAIRTAEKKLFENAESLYIRIKKLAVKYDCIERLFRTKADCIFIKVKNAEIIQNKLYEKEIAIRFEGEYLCVFSGSKEENELFLEKFEALLS